MIRPYKLVGFGLLGLLLGSTVAAGLQIGFNSLRYLVQPQWLVGTNAWLLLLFVGVGGALAIGGGVGCLLRLADKNRIHPLAIIFGLALGYGLDPYYLAELGWRDPAMMQGSMRALSVLIPAFGFALGLRLKGSMLMVFTGFVSLAALLHALMPRFAGIPILGGDLDLAILSPIHIFVFLRGMFFFLLAIAMQYLSHRLWTVFMKTSPQRREEG
ncbi:hypothetical protein JCM17844_17100 [Iodidimonas gelatinilytica]|uniref:Uncharacterized protein n=1 Tax=Iodidimonas gelatinilytica TaxID=1236966 RepID=A0A5A7MS54_9PROT|nr:hypothetical protein [Iodidimonas gelatinilytica]GEQ98073.1 hypothetical protein JCM17844_17100 [Iodidimonas gelatinilytica]